MPRSRPTIIPQQGQAPQYAPPQAPAPAPINRQGLSSLESARNAPTHDFDNYPRTQPPAYAQQARQAPPQQQRPQPTHQAPLRPQGGAPADDPIRAAGGYRQAAPQPQYAPRAPQPAPSYDQWPAPAQPSHDPYGHDLGAYLPGDAPFPANSNHPNVDPLQQGDWAISPAGYGDPALEQQYARGYDQQHAGALEPTYNQEEAGAYEVEEPRRRSWTMRIAGAVVVAIGLGYGLAQAYKAVLGGPAPDGATPVVASDATPAREKPLDPGGKQFSHTDSKVLGRLGEAGAAPEEGAGGLSESDASNGSRKVTTLVVGRDGQIAPPSASGEPAPPAHEDSVSVPGLTVVDAFGSAAQAPPQRSAPAEPPHQQQAEAEPVVVNNPPPKARVNVKSTKVIPAETASVPAEEPARCPGAEEATRRRCRSDDDQRRRQQRDRRQRIRGGAGFSAGLGQQPPRCPAQVRRHAATVRPGAGQQDAGRARDDAGGQGCLPPPAGRSAGVTLAGQRAVHAAQGFRLQGLLGYRLLSSLFGARSTRAPGDAIRPHLKFASDR